MRPPWYVEDAIQARNESRDSQRDRLILRIHELSRLRYSQFGMREMPLEEQDRLTETIWYLDALKKSFGRLRFARSLPEGSGRDAQMHIFEQDWEYVRLHRQLLHGDITRQEHAVRTRVLDSGKLPHDEAWRGLYKRLVAQRLR